MSKLRVFGTGALHAAAAAAYAAFVAYLMPRLAPQGPDNSFSIAAFLLIFCVSAAVMASLVFLRPLLWYLDGKKREGIYLLIAIIICLFLAAAAALVSAHIAAPPVYIL